MNLPMLKPVQSGTELAQDCPITDMGLDVGNGSLKFAIAGHFDTVPSYVRWLEPGEIDVPKRGGMVHYIAGDRARDLQGKSWVIGEVADTENAIRIVDELDRKPAYALHHLLGALALLPYRPEWRLNIVASIHNRHLWDAMKASLAGTHEVSCNGGLTSIVQILATRIVDEGVGALALNPNAARLKPLVIDIGHGTLQALLYGTGFKRANGKTRNSCGVDALVQLIADSAEFQARFDDRGNVRVIREAIQRGTFRHGGYDFKPVFDEKLMRWKELHLKPFFSSIREWKLGAEYLLAVGGGCKLGTLTTELEQAGYHVPQDPVNANAIGLLHLAQKVRGGAV